MGRIDAYSHILPSAVYEEYREISDDTVPSVLDDPIMTDEGIDERLALLDEYDIERTDLPKIKRTDPALPDDAESGDVVKIVRDSRTTDTAIVYRLVIE